MDNKRTVMNSLKIKLALAVVALGLALPASADVINIYKVGASAGTVALDPLNNPIGSLPVISWTDTLSGPISGSYFLSILAEGVDGGPDAPAGGEHDSVFVNGTFIGMLTQQGFYSPLFNLQPGPGALAGITGETLSTFDVSAFLVGGLNTFSVVVDPGNWINEIEVATLTLVPEPGTLALLGLGLVVLGVGSGRKHI
jgi:hypothetical protein